MKWQLSASTLVAIVQLTNAREHKSSSTSSLSCHTKYQSTPITGSVPTTTETKTTTVTSTSQVVEYSYVVVEEPFTYIVISGKQTTTVPTGASFIPIISAPSGNSPWVGKKHKKRQHQLNQRRAAATTKSSPKPLASSSSSSSSSPSPTPTSFPKAITCTSTLSLTHTLTTTSTETITDVTYPTYTSTSSVPVSTAYAACEAPSNNILSSWQGSLLSAVSGDDVESICDGEDETRAGIGCVDAKTCCEEAQRTEGFTGFQYRNDSVAECLILKGWYFFTQEPGYLGYFGNGRDGTGMHALN